jgi:hypothetical protein
MERAIRGRISAGRAAGELPTDADRTSLRKIVDQRCARGRAIGRKLNVAADQERIEMGLTGLPAPAMFKLSN